MYSKQIIEKFVVELKFNTEIVIFFWNLDQITFIIQIDLSFHAFSNFEIYI